MVTGNFSNTFLNLILKACTRTMSVNLFSTNVSNETGNKVQPQPFSFCYKIVGLLGLSIF